LAIGLTNCQSEWVARSFENLTSDYGVLRRYLGELKFKHLINEYISTQHDKVSNERWLSDHLPDFIAAYETFMHFPEIAELALLERAQNRAFNAIDALTLAKLSTIPPPAKKLKTHPSVSLLTFSQNTTSIWSALICDEQPPRPHSLDAPQHVIVWRQGNTTRFRILGEDEALALGRVSLGISSKALNSESYLLGWLEAELILAPAVAA
jgi:hypothetical protein